MAYTWEDRMGWLTEPGMLGLSWTDILAGLGGLAFGGVPGALITGGLAHTLGGVSRGNRLAEQLREDTQWSFGEAQQAVEELKGDPFLNLNLEEALSPAFHTGERLNQFWSGIRPEDFRGNVMSDLLEGATAPFEGARRAVEALPSRIEDITRGFTQDVFSLDRPTALGTEDLLSGVDLPTTDLSEVLGARLSGIGTAGASAQEQAVRELAADAQRAGLGLEGSRRLGTELGFTMGGQRAAEAATAIGQTRAEEASREIARAELQSQAASRAAELNALAERLIYETQAGALTGAFGTRTGAETRTGELLSDLALGESRAYTSAFAPSVAESEGGLARVLEVTREQARAAGLEADDRTLRALTMIQLLADRMGKRINIAELLSNLAASRGQVFQPYMGEDVVDLTSMGLDLKAQREFERSL